MKKSLKFLLLILTITTTSIIKAQDTDNDPSRFLPNITPPSPEAFKFVQYGNTPIGLTTGTPNIQLPLFVYKTTNLSVPFSLNYSSGGIKVDEANSKTGYGWNLIGGGIITRTVRNLEDDFISDFPLKHLNVTSLNKTNALVNIYFNLFGDNGKDSERDLFVFNFLGFSGKFYFDDNNKIVFLEKCDLKIDVINTVGEPIFTFLVTGTDGTKYFFQATEETSLRTSGGGHAPPSTKVTGWYLTKIVHPKGDEIYFAYDNFNQSYVQSESQQTSRSYPFNQTCASGQSYSKAITFGPVYSHDIRIIGKKILSITSNNPVFGSVGFTYEDKIIDASGDPDNVIKTITTSDKNAKIIEKIDFDYLVTPNRRIFLNGFHFLDPSNKYSFSYITPEIFPSRLSKSQDHWGYFNGANNSALIPKVEGYGFENYAYNYANREIDSAKSRIGLLNRITYPTKGYTDIEYESNDYYGLKTIIPPLVSQTMVLDNDDSERRNETTINISGGFSYTAKITGNTGFANCDSSLNTGSNHHKGHVTVFCVQDNAYVNIFEYSAYGIEVNGQTDLMLSSDASRPYYFYVQKDKNYIVKLYNYYECIHSSMTIEYYTGTSQTIYTNILTGGSRVSNTKDYASSALNPVIKKYSYFKFDQPTISSGITFQEPYYINFSNHLDGGTLHCTVFDAVLNSSSISSLFEMGSNVYYKYVTVSNGNNFENGYEENEFTINSDYREVIYLGDREFRNVPWSNIGWDNGKLFKTKMYEKRNTSYILRKEITNNYLKDTNNPTVVNYAIYNTAPGIFATSTQEDCTCTASNIGEFYTVKYCSAIHFHQKDSNGNCIAAGANNIIQNINHPCFGKTAGQILGIPPIAHLNIMPYKYISYFSYLANTVTNDYDLNGLNPITTTVNYNYNSPNHLQLVSKTTANSLGETIKTEYKYPSDLIGIEQTPYMQQLANANRISEPVMTKTFNGNTKLSEEHTKYENSASTANLLLPTEIHVRKGANDINIAAIEDRKVQFTKYDTNGNIQQYMLENGAPVSIIWGYNKTQPIAKIENATYSQVSSFVANLQTISDTGTEADLLLALSALRNDPVLTNAMVTTYTHIPLVGVSTITDPKEDKITYTYDSFGRLEFVKDKDGNILSENQYNYKQ